MSPKLFVYNGIELLFFSDDHLPVHVHAIYGKTYGMKVEFAKENNKVISIEYKKLKGFKKFKELTDSTIVVVVGLVILGAYVAGWDFIMIYVMKAFTFGIAK